jgi:hypothetical protein
MLSGGQGREGEMWCVCVGGGGVCWSRLFCMCVITVHPPPRSRHPVHPYPLVFLCCALCLALIDSLYLNALFVSVRAVGP